MRIAASVAVALALLFWLFRPVPRRGVPAPEDDVRTPIDRDELDAAEREVRRDRQAKSLGSQAEEDVEDDWGPGTR